MDLEVTIKYHLWPYTKSISVHIPEDDFKNMDKYVDSITNNLKMDLLTHVRTHHPTIWHKYVPSSLDNLKDLTI